LRLAPATAASVGACRRCWNLRGCWKPLLLPPKLAAAAASARVHHHWWNTRSAAARALRRWSSPPPAPMHPPEGGQRRWASISSRPGDTNDEILLPPATPLSSPLDPVLRSPPAPMHPPQGGTAFPPKLMKRNSSRSILESATCCNLLS
jgi:hypothetical protein